MQTQRHARRTTSISVTKEYNYNSAEEWISHGSSGSKELIPQYNHILKKIWKLINVYAEHKESNAQLYEQQQNSTYGWCGFF